MAEITRVFYSSHLEVGDVLRLPEKENYHVYKVLRGRVGDRIEVVDGAGRLLIAELLKGEQANIIEERPAEHDEGTVTLYQSIPKGRHMDLVVEKATELGVGRIVPLGTERGVVRLEDGAGKVRRWRRVVEAAARQSLRLRIPEVEEVVSFPEAVREAGESGVLLHNGPDLPPLENVVRAPSVSLFVGPEGGWSEVELAKAKEASLRFAALGPFRLRSETAGMVAVARACAACTFWSARGASRGAGERE